MLLLVSGFVVNDEYEERLREKRNNSLKANYIVAIKIF